MKETKRDVGSEILEGLRELRRGECGRVINVGELNRIRKETGLRNNDKSESVEGM